MKRKLTSGILMLAALLTTSTAFYSCKDYDDERTDAIESQHSKLEQTLKDWVNANVASCTCTIKDAEGVKGVVTANYVRGYISDAYVSGLGFVKDSELDEYVKEDAVSGIVNEILDGKDFSTVIDQYMGSTGKGYTNILDQLAKDEDGNLVILNDIDDLEGRVTVVEDSVKFYDIRLKNIDGKVEKVKLSVDSLKNRVSSLEDAVAQLENKVERLYDIYKAQVTGVIVQGVSNPVVGTFALPVGIQSNILAGYYGEIDGSYIFPSADDDAASFAIDENNVFTAADAKVAGFDNVSEIIAGDLYNSNLGTLYVTVNPNTVDFTGKTLELVNSKDENPGIKLDTLKKSSSLLKFGYTRADAASNGFYETTASVNSTDLSNIKLDFNASGLKSVVSDVLSYNDGIDFTNAAAQIYKAASNLGDAYALKATYTDTLGEHSVYTNYNIGAYAVNPLSYAFMKNGVNLPALRTLPEGLTTETLKEKLGLNDLKIEIKDITIDTIADMKDTIRVKIVIDGKEGGKITIPDEIKYHDADADHDKPYVTYTTKDIVIGKDGVIEAPYKVSMADINKLLIGDNGIVTQVNSALADVNDQIQKMINNTLNGASSYLDTYNTYASKVNSMLKRVYNSVKNINSKLQPVLVYDHNGSYSIMSSTKGVGTPIEYTAAKGGLTIYPTSYTAELFAPAYKKYLGVTNVWKTSDFSTSAQDGDETCQKAADTANSESTHFGKVIDGNIYYAVFAGESGFTYEIAYGCVDYNGKQAVRKFYVTVK